MRSLVLSDLFLGTDGSAENGAALRDLLLRAAGPRVQVIFTGNTFDFVAAPDPIELDAAAAARRAAVFVETPEIGAAMWALGELLARGGEATMRMGATDVELLFPAVQAVLRGALGQPEQVARRLSFVYGDSPVPLEAGGVHVVAAHGEHMDEASRVDYFRLPGPDGSPPLKGGAFRRPDGIVLYKDVLAPLRRDFGMRFVDALRPFYRAAAVAAMFVDTAAIKRVLKGLSWSFFKELFAGSKVVMAFDDEGEGDTFGRIGRMAKLDDDEEDALRELFEKAGDDDEIGSFDGEAALLVRAAARKLAVAALRQVARVERVIAAASGSASAAPAEPSLDPDDGEMAEADRLAKKYQASVVLLGHTGVPRWKEEESLLYANTGTWAPRLTLPAVKAKSDEWEDLVKRLRKDPSGQLVSRARRTCVTVDPWPGDGALGGAVIRLCEVAPGGALSTVREAHVPSTPLH
jgi:hypothetical protein